MMAHWKPYVANNENIKHILYYKTHKQHHADVIGKEHIYRRKAITRAARKYVVEGRLLAYHMHGVIFVCFNVLN